MRRQSWPYLLAIGLVAGLGLATKYTMVFVGPVVLGFILVKGRGGKWRR
ncbi:MAG: glycosyltransferase family 39 protein [Anaerolineae bacterium]|nr:glycosyltransferase family 39 protein [Anaerolineae bacterium]